LRFFRIAVLIIVAVILEYNVAHHMSLGGIRPNFLAMLVSAIGLWWGSMAGVASGFATGLLGDLDLHRYLGLSALALSTVGYFSGAVSNKIDRESPLSQFTVLLSAVIIHDIIFGAVFFFGNYSMFMKRIFLATIPSSLYTALIGLLCMRILGLWFTSGRSRR
jgi:rod shape-determining protein MreD